MNQFKLEDGSITGPRLKIDAGALVEPERQADPEDGKLIIIDAIVDMLNGAFVTGAQQCREMMARFVENQGLPDIAASIRANWNPRWGQDPGKLE